MLMQCLALAALAFPAAAARTNSNWARRPVIRSANPQAGSTMKRAGWIVQQPRQAAGHYTLKKAASPLPLAKAAGEPKFEYQFENQTHTLDDLLARQRVTGLLADARTARFC